MIPRSSVGVVARFVMPSRLAVVHLGVQRDDLVGVFEHAFARRGQVDAVMGTVEQAGVEILFELADLERNRGLRHVQRLGRLGETEQPRHGVEYLQSPVSHTLILSPASLLR
jgi:hypothetical protein